MEESGRWLESGHDLSKFSSENKHLPQRGEVGQISKAKGCIKKQGDTADSRETPCCSAALLSVPPSCLKWKLEFEIKTL